MKDYFCSQHPSKAPKVFTCKSFELQRFWIAKVLSCKTLATKNFCSSKLLKLKTFATRKIIQKKTKEKLDWTPFGLKTFGIENLWDRIYFGPTGFPASCPPGSGIGHPPAPCESAWVVLNRDERTCPSGGLGFIEFYFPRYNII